MTSKTIKTLIGLACIVVLCGLALTFGPTDAEGRWYSILPPLLAITAAFVTQNVFVSLGLAIIVGGLLTQWDALGQGFVAWGHGLGTSLGFVGEAVRPFNEGGGVAENMFILGFVYLIFAMVEILVQAGGFAGIVQFLLRWIKGRRTTELMTSLLGVGCFIDDYTNAIIVGSTMRPITDRFGVSRAKLAFIVDATSAPVSGLAVVSTWIAYEVGLFGDVATSLNLDKNGYAMFFDALGFRFYCVFMLAFVFLLIARGRDFGPMAKAQAVMDQQDASTEEISIRVGKARTALIPLLGLIVFHLSALWWFGGGSAKLDAGGSLASWDYWRATLSDVESSSRVLMMSSSFGLILGIVCTLLWERMAWRDMLRAAACGAKKGLPPTGVLILAWSLKNCCDALHTGNYLSDMLVGSISPIWFAPLVFIIAAVTSFATGTSWGTMAILIPTAVPVAYGLDGGLYGLTTMMTLGAVLDGAIFGDHCSPISDTTIISSTACQCDLITHVRTQLPYSIVVAVIAVIVGYLPRAYGLPWWGCLLIAAGAMWAVMQFWRNKAAKV